MEDDPHPSPDEIKPFVAVGPSKEYSVTVHKQTFDQGFILVTIIFILIIVTVLICCIFFAIKETDINPATPLPDANLNITLRSNLDTLTPLACQSISNTQWKNNRCQCIDPYTGNNCNIIKHDPLFFPVGIPNEPNLGINVIKDTISEGKSFSPNSCSELCNSHADCTGFLYRDPNYCTLIRDKVVVPAGDNIGYSEDLDSTLYLRSSNNLKFEGRIFIAHYPGHFPPRYWLVKEAPYYKQLFPRELGEINFYPNYVNIYGCYTGIYCLHPFTLENIPIMMQDPEPESCYIHEPKTELIVPDHWRYTLPIYVMYIPAN